MKSGLKKASALILAVMMISALGFTAFADDANSGTFFFNPVGDLTQLKAGDVFQVELGFKDITGFTSAQVKVKFDPSKVQLANASGVASETGMFQSVLPMYKYDEESGTASGVFSTVGVKGSNTEGYATYCIYINQDQTEIAKGTPYPVTNNQIVFTKLRFVVVETGDTGIDLDMDPKVTLAYFADAYNVATINYTKTPIIVGGEVEKTIKSIETVAPVTVEKGTSFNDVVAQLPAKLTVTYTDDSTAELDVVWTCADYDPNTAGEYTFTGTVTDENNNTASTTVKVTVVEPSELPFVVTGSAKRVGQTGIILNFDVKLAEGQSYSGDQYFIVVQLMNGDTPITVDGIKIDKDNSFSTERSYSLPSIVTEGYKVKISVVSNFKIDEQVDSEVLADRLDLDVVIPAE